MNGVHFLVFAVTVFGAVYFIPRALAYDRMWFILENLDDEELEAYRAEFGDVLDWRWTP